MKLTQNMAHLLVNVLMLKLVAPEYSHKQWNKYREFSEFLKVHEVIKVLFSYKDQRFGCLSRAAAVLLFNFDMLSLFLKDNPSINNRLACLVRDLMELPYIKAVLVVFAAFGIQLIEPFFSKTIQKGATHTSLGIFYKSIYTSMEKKLTFDFFTFESPNFDGVSKDLFKGVKDSYGNEVVASVVAIASQHQDEVIKLANICLPELRTILARQRRDYGISDEFPAQYPVKDQTEHIDQTPVHNLDAERRFGKVDYRLKKLQTLEAASRSLILERARDLKEGKETQSFRSCLHFYIFKCQILKHLFFRTFRKEAEAKREVELAWSKKMRDMMAKGYSEKQVLGQIKERKRLNMLEQLKIEGGPFTDAEAVSKYLESPLENPRKKQSRHKLELRFARESSTNLPQSDQLF